MITDKLLSYLIEFQGCHSRCNMPGNLSQCFDTNRLLALSNSISSAVLICYHQRTSNIRLNGRGIHRLLFLLPGLISSDRHNVASANDFQFAAAYPAQHPPESAGMCPRKNWAKLCCIPSKLAKAGIMATNARNIDPGRVILDMTVSINSAGFLSWFDTGNKTSVFLHILCHLGWIHNNGGIKIGKNNDQQCKYDIVPETGITW